MWKRRSLYLGLLALAVVGCQAQTINAPSEQKQTATSPQSGQQLPVNWLYGAYVPTEAPLESLSDADRWKLYVRMSFTTPGIYIKTAFLPFAIRSGMRLRDGHRMPRVSATGWAIDTPSS